MSSKTSFTNTGSWFVSSLRQYTYLFSPGSTIENEENTVFQRKQHLKLYALDLTQDFRKSTAQYIYLRSFLESLVKQLLCYACGPDAVDAFHLFSITF